MKKGKDHFGYMKRVSDGDTVIVGWSLDAAIKHLKSKVGRYQTMRTLKLRRNFPARGERLRAKRKMARNRLKTKLKNKGR